MAIAFTFNDRTQLTDGNWNGSPAGTPTADDIKTTDNVNISDAFDWSGTLELTVIGDFNGGGELLEVDISGATSVDATLFDNDNTNDDGFTGDTGPTAIGAQPNQGNISINGEQGSGTSGFDPFSSATIDAIENDSATFLINNQNFSPAVVQKELNNLTGDVNIQYTITEFNSNNPDAQGGVDFAQIDTELSVEGDWYGDKAISNVVFYFDCGEDGIEKIAIDGWSELTDENGLPVEYTSTEGFDFSAENIAAMAAAKCGLDLEECDFVGMTIKAGNNTEDGFKPNEANGEGEIIFGDIESDYGAQNDRDCEVFATDVLEQYFMA